MPRSHMFDPDGEREHELSSNCWCEPVVTNFYVIHGGDEDE